MWAPRFLIGNSTTVALIVCAASTLTLAVFLQKRDAVPQTLSGVSETEDELVGQQVEAVEDRKRVEV